ncbi:hypothetical protein JMJ35_009274 [Cladonia borealis]|uniref:Nucleoporin Nup54 alpha-helical domain-containing protein n=1 Tax=Cladonia borealis TaxID=184061 RepID=A0AA39QUA5_9LECA|nr:hypothetical protein JMJ35_009274 [Cladonia borealis]
MSLFGQNNSQQQQDKPNIFGSLNLNTNNTTSTQGQSGGGLFGSTSQPGQSSLFGTATTSAAQPSGGLFDKISKPATTAANPFGSFGSTTTQPAQSGGGLFGNLGSSTSQPAQSGGLFSNLGGSTTQPVQSGGGLFGNLGSSTNQSNQQSGGGLFGSQQQQPQQGSSLFGNLGGSTNQQQSGGLFGGLGNTANQQPQQQNQQQQGSSLFGNWGQNTQQPQQNQQQGNVLGQTQGSRLFQQSEYAPPQKSVIQQIELAHAKWNPQSPETLFRTYLYNVVKPEEAAYYGPTPQDRESEWEEALSKKPRPGSIPILVRGFAEIAERMKMQYQVLTVLRGRLHEINAGLNTLLQKHDLEISVRAAECRRKHLRLSHQCLGLAAKTQVLRNRGYAMDSAEEELRKKLLLLERSVFDPALNGRGEEIWARMVSVRETGRQLQRQFEKAGRSVQQENGGIIDEEVMKRVKKILEDYSSQLAQLAKELVQIQKDWAEWEASTKPAALGR